MCALHNKVSVLNLLFICDIISGNSIFRDKVNKRKAYILQRRGEEKGGVQKERVAKAFNKWLDGKPLTKVMPGEVVDFLIFKEMEGKGRTVVHRETCPRLGTRSKKNAEQGTHTTH